MEVKDKEKTTSQNNLEKKDFGSDPERTAAASGVLKDAESLLAFCSLTSVLVTMAFCLTPTSFSQKRMSPELKVKLKIALKRKETLVTLW